MWHKIWGVAFIDFRLIITYFGTLKMSQIAPFTSLFSGEHALGPPSTSVNHTHSKANYAPGM